jgi:hypothetical protein
VLHQPEAKIAAGQSLERLRDRIRLDVEAMCCGAAPSRKRTEGSVSTAEIEE